MKLEEMADLLIGLASTFEKFLGKTAASDLQAVGELLRRFPGETVARFCSLVIEARDGKAPTRRKGGASGEEAVALLVDRVKHYLEHQDTYDFPAVRQLAADIGKLKAPQIKAVGQSIGCPLTDRTKAQMVSRLENWLVGIKLSAEQSSFRLTPAGVG